MTYAAILKDLESGKFQPVYTLQGEEPFFIDHISDYIEAHALTEAEKSFNLSIIYGRDVKYLDLMDTVRRYPMMAPRQVVILREAQQMKELEKLLDYVKNPTPTTVLVICHKYKKIRRNTTFGKQLEKHSVFFNSDPL